MAPKFREVRGSVKRKKQATVTAEWLGAKRTSERKVGSGLSRW
jgi:hypothetical protein